MDILVKYLCIIQARTSSTRLPAKIMLDLDGETLLQRCIQSVAKSKYIDKIVVATSKNSEDDIVEDKLKLLDVNCFRGSLDNVLERFYMCAKSYEAINIVRVTADNALVEGKLIDKLIKVYEKEDVDYTVFEESIYGISSEVFFHIGVWKKLFFNTDDSYDIEHVTPYIKKNFKSHFELIEKAYRGSDIRATIDTFEDYIRMQKFYLFCKKSNLEANLDTYLKYLKEI